MYMASRIFSVSDMAPRGPIYSSSKSSPSVMSVKSHVPVAFQQVLSGIGKGLGVLGAVSNTADFAMQAAKADQPSATDQFLSGSQRAMNNRSRQQQLGVLGTNMAVSILSSILSFL